MRTRSDVPLQTVIANDTSMLDAALASGAQLISTDFPQIGMSARYDSDLGGTPALETSSHDRGVYEAPWAAKPP